MIALYIIGAIILLLFAVLLLPFKVQLAFLEDFSFKVKFLFFTVYKPKEKQEKKVAKQQPQEKKQSLFQKLKDKKGFIGAVKEVFVFLSEVLGHIKYLFRFIRFKNVRFNLNVTGDDAAETAINYGIVCSAVYPVLSFFDSIAKVKYKKIDIKSDFDSKESDFSFSLDISLQLLFLLISGFRIYKEYKKFSVRNDLQ